MRLLLDTHVLLWWILDEPKLSQGYRDALKTGSNVLFWSAASSWEVAIKYELGHLPLPRPPELFLPDQLKLNRVQSLPISDTHAFEAGQLPRHHRDPFDRMLVGQARREALTMLTDDPRIRLYDVAIHPP